MKRFLIAGLLVVAAISGALLLIALNLAFRKAPVEALPKVGQTAMYQYGVHIACPQSFGCPDATLDLWTVNLGRGYYVYTGSLHLDVVGIGATSMRASSGFWSAGGGAGGGGGNGGSAKIERWITKHTGHQWPYSAYQSALEGDLEVVSKQEHLLAQAHKYPRYMALATGRFEGKRVYELDLPDGPQMYEENSEMYVDARSGLLRSETMSACVRWRFNENGFPSPCRGYDAVQITLDSASYVPTCSISAERYAFFFSRPGFRIRKRPNKPQCGAHRSKAA